MAMPVKVLMSETASAPPCSAALAQSAMEVTLGVSLTISGTPAFCLARLVTSSMTAGSVPKGTPPACTLGQEMFSSIMSTPEPASFAVISA